MIQNWLIFLSFYILGIIAGTMSAMTALWFLFCRPIKKFKILNYVIGFLILILCISGIIFLKCFLRGC